MITVKNISKSFGSVKAVDDLTFSIKSGEVVGLLGPNGAGKTTTMRLITGYLMADFGEIEVEGINVRRSIIEAQKLIGYLPENNPLYREMTIVEMLEYSARLKNVLDIKEAVDEVVNLTGLADYYYRPIGQLSKGFRQRTGLAVALLNRPKVLVLDEPAEGMDPKQREEMRKLIRHLGKDRTIILSTHVMQEAEAVCERLLVIDKGRLIADGSPEKLTRQTIGTAITLEIEGKDVEKKLAKSTGIVSCQLVRRRGNHLILSIKPDKQMVFQPKLAELVSENHWIIWRLEEEKADLDSVFRQLTKDK